MRVALLCSSLEPGRDGVGDYATLLAKECARQGHPTALIALNDRTLKQTTEGMVREDTTDVPYLRLTNEESWAVRTAKATIFLQKFAPDWISLQFVPYGFQNKGIVLGLGSLLSCIIASVRPRPLVHLLFHELWIGGSYDAPHKDKIVGFIQRYAIQRLVQKIQPNIVHTTNTAYRAGLAQLKINANLLPLFGSIPLVERSAEGDAWFLAQLQKERIPFHWEKRHHFWICGMFGAIHPEWSPLILLPLLREAARESGRDIIFLSVGNMRRGVAMWQDMAEAYSDTRINVREENPGKMYFMTLGEQPEAQISRCLSAMDFGIATTPLGLLGKSSTVAAMWEHGLPIVVTRLETPFQGTASTKTNTSESTGNELDLLYILKDPDAFRDNIRDGWVRRPPNSRLSAVARRFIGDLDECRNAASQVAPEQRNRRRS